ncbi:MAG: hypothetical protein AB1393_13795 [Candidatus Edwardsbacteria bacterium]
MNKMNLLQEILELSKTNPKLALRYLKILQQSQKTTDRILRRNPKPISLGTHFKKCFR